MAFPCISAACRRPVELAGRFATAAATYYAVYDPDCVAALNGAPGILSARFAGQPTDDERNSLELLRRLSGVAQRQAHYTCALVAVRAADDPEPLIVDARWNGEIALAPRGEGGFGYDPLFFVPELGVTAAELDGAHKNRISHRGLAMAALAEKIAYWR